MEFTFKKDQEKDITIVKLSGNLLAEVESKDFLARMTDKINEGEVNFIFDLSDMQFINISGLGMLLTCLTKARKAGGEVILAEINKQLQDLLAMTKLSSIFTTSSSMKEAMQQFQTSA
ncbi:MAG: hypothetical protein BRD50_05420 [Bacteroidetes bacterium SW_11_45_7]|nr:MAG: hypothetical protein BRD50_05420 [Bacteroidetes bacterium SW_11_45_7]